MSNVQPWTNAQHTSSNSPFQGFSAAYAATILALCCAVQCSFASLHASMQTCKLHCPSLFTKNALDRILVLSRTNNLNYPRCHLEFTIKLVRLAGYQHIPDKWRMPSRHRILWISGWMINPFDCALSGPFDNLFHTWFSAPQALCKGMIAVISASPV